jgi:DNA-directed RNA polymerase subunit RPC12/RpoP
MKELFSGLSPCQNCARKASRLIQTKSGKQHYDCRECGFRSLPVWRQYTIDERLQEFRKVTYKDGNPAIEFIPFASKRGMKLQYQIDKERLKRVL